MYYWYDYWAENRYFRASDDRNTGRYSMSSSPYYRNLSYNPQRVSVDEGSFTPGRYRVNPYYISSAELSSDPAEEFLSVKSADFKSSNFSYQVYRKSTINRRSIIGHLMYEGFNLPRRGTATLKQLALQKAHGKLGKADLELGETIGEYRETVNMLRHPLKQLREFLIADRARNLRLLKALASGDKRMVNVLLGRTGLATADTMASTWMELRYGLRPLVMLVQDVVERVNSKKTDIVDPEKIRSAKSMLSFTFNDVVWRDWTHMTYMRLEGSCNVKDTIQTTASVQYTQTKGQGFLDSLGLSPRFLPEVAWQLTKLSYVVDWIFTIGPWLATLRVNPGITVLGSTVGCKYVREVNFKGQRAKFSNIPSNEVLFVELPQEHVATVQEYGREVSPDLSYLPHFTWGRVLDLFKAIDSIALIWQFRHK